MNIIMVAVGLASYKLGYRPSSLGGNAQATNLSTREAWMASASLPRVQPPPWGREHGFEHPAPPFPFQDVK